MNELVRLDLKPIVERVAEVLRGHPAVAGAYLFGSALEQCNAAALKEYVEKGR